MDHCDECGFEYAELPEQQIGSALLHLVPQYGTILATDPSRLREHPISGVWSALEYACHVRDIFEVQRERVELALEKDEPSFEPMGREERVVRDRYNEQDPTDVERELARRARALADLFERLGPDDLARRAIYNWPERAPQTIAWIGRHTVHEGRHHLRDIEHVLDAVSSA
jgi:hypothetical protein